MKINNIKEFFNQIKYQYLKISYNDTYMYAKFINLDYSEYEDDTEFIELLVRNLKDNIIYSFDIEDIDKIEIMLDEEITKFNRSKNNDRRKSN